MMPSATGSNKQRGGGLILTDLQKAFGKTTAVEGISLTVRPGEFLTLLGPSGSGKSTTLMMIAGITESDSGTIVLDGKQIANLPTHRRSIGVVFQSYALFPHMNVFENVAFALRMRDFPDGEINARVAAIIAQVRLTGLDNRYPRQLSGGQQQRVALARALVFNPSLLLLDEPLGALDRLLREHMKLELRRIHRELGTSMIYVTHDQDEALVLSDTIAVMNNGRIEQIGTPDEIYERPQTAFVARFIGDSNFLRGQVKQIEGPMVDVLAGNVLLRGHASGKMAVGQVVDVAVRPEKISLTECGPAAVHCGVVADKIYHGESIRYSVRFADTQIFVRQVKRQGSYQPSIDENVALSWSVDDVLVFSVEA